MEGLGHSALVKVDCDRSLDATWADACHARDGMLQVAAMPAEGKRTSANERGCPRPCKTANRPLAAEGRSNCLSVRMVTAARTTTADASLRVADRHCRDWEMAAELARVAKLPAGKRPDRAAATRATAARQVCQARLLR